MTIAVESYSLLFRTVLGCLLLVINATGLTLNAVVLSTCHLTKTTVSNVSNILITNLNIMDITICVTALPLTLTLVLTSRQQTPLFCLFHEATISFASSASAVGLLVITLHRYASIVTPFKERLTVRNVKLTVAIVWALSAFGFASPLLALTTSRWFLENNQQANRTAPRSAPEALIVDKLQCAKTFEPVNGLRVYYELYYVILYLIASTTMLFCYTKITLVARSRVQIRLAMIAPSMKLPGMPSNIQMPSAQVAQKTLDLDLTRMTMSVVSTFMVCWGPHAITNTVMLFTGSSYTLEMVQLGCLTLAYSSSALHPLIYVFMRPKFLRAISQRITKWRGAWNRQTTQRVHDRVENVSQSLSN